MLILRNMSTHIKELEKQLKALANFRRLEIIRYLFSVHTASVSEIAQHIKLSFKSTSRHLAVLRSAEILETKQVNLNVFYSLSKPSTGLMRVVLS